MNDYAKMLPALLSGDALVDALKDIPEYDASVTGQDTAVRLMKLSDIYKIYLPSQMTVEIYNKLYMATVMSLQKKGTKLAVRQQNITFHAIQGNGYRGIIGGSDSFTVIGTSGIGKSSAIERAISLISGNGILETAQPYSRIIPCMVVQCPYDCSPKGMLLEILRIVDMNLGTTYYQKSQRAGVTTDLLIGTVAQVSLNHIGLLIIDEIQHVAGHKNGRTLVGMLTQLVNCSGISVCMVGVPESIPFFEQAMQLARRSVGLKYGALPYDGYFRKFVGLLFQYQYVKNRTELSDGILEWLYEHSGGIISIVVSLVHDAQEIAIFSGREILDVEALNEAYVKRLALLHDFVSPSVRRNQKLPQKKSKPVEIASKEGIKVSSDYLSIPEVVQKAKNQSVDVVSLLRDYVSVTEVSI